MQDTVLRFFYNINNVAHTFTLSLTIVIENLSEFMDSSAGHHDEE